MHQAFALAPVSSSSGLNFKRLVPGSFKVGLIGSTCFDLDLPRAAAVWGVLVDMLKGYPKP
jgi:hypothetical protein